MRLTFKIILLCSVLAFAACKDKKVEIPAGVLDKETLAQVLADFALAESAANINIKNITAPRIDSAYAFNPLTENKVSRAQYDSSIAFYAAHGDLYKEVYEITLAKLSRMQTQRDSLNSHPASK